MTNSKIHRLPFDKDAITVWASERAEHTNWPVVYTINDDKQIYVGETTNAELRMRQHLVTQSKRNLETLSVIVDENFNKSVCLDLESHLIKYFSADEKFEVLNGNGGITDADYFQRDKYRASFDEIFDELVASGILTRSIPDIVNSDLFKYSPFKALTGDQAIAIEGILEKLFDERAKTQNAPIVIHGEPGTGKTIVAVYLMKLLRDIALSKPDEVMDVDSLFADFFQDGYRQEAVKMRIGLVIPQQSLRKTVEKVFSKTPGLDKSMILGPLDLGNVDDFDLLIVDETHRLQQRNNQPAATLNTKYKETNIKLFGHDEVGFTQLDWVKAKSKNQIFLLDKDQTVKPADLPEKTVNKLVEDAGSVDAFFRLTSQMRVNGGNDYIDYVTRVLRGEYKGPLKTFGKYDVRLFLDFNKMHTEILAKNNEVGLARLVAGFAWPWVTRNGADFDIEIQGSRFAWNRRDYDWINSPTSVDEVGSIHTIQGYDLNFAGVIIGADLSYDPLSQKLIFNRENYHDKKGKENNRVLGITYTDEDMLAFVTNIYRVLMTRGVLGTFLYVVDPDLRNYLQQFFATA
jgi:uncharacterized protein